MELPVGTDQGLFPGWWVEQTCAMTQFDRLDDETVQAL